MRLDDWIPVIFVCAVIAAVLGVAVEAALDRDGAMEAPEADCPTGSGP